MVSLLANLVWSGLLHGVVTIGFLVAAVPLLAFVVVDLRRAARESARKKNGSMQFMSRHRDEHGMPIFFEAGEDPSARSARRVLTQKRRSSGAAGTRTESGQ
jgi:hypothetical protein